MSSNPRRGGRSQPRGQVPWGRGEGDSAETPWGWRGNGQLEGEEQLMGGRLRGQDDKGRGEKPGDGQQGRVQENKVMMIAVREQNQEKLTCDISREYVFLSVLSISHGILGL